MRPERLAWTDSLSAKRLRALAAILLVWVVILSGTVRAVIPAPQLPANPAYDSQSFLKELGRLKTQLETARQSTEELRSFRESLPQAWAVDAGGHHYDVPTDLLVSRLVKAERQSDLRETQVNWARDYLNGLADETASLSGQPLSLADSARTKLDAILARSEFASTRQQSWWDEIRARINQILFNALERILRGVGGQKSLGYALLWLGICATVVIIAYWVFQRWFRAARGEEMALQAAAVPARSWQEWVFAARESGARGDYRMAIHCAYWAGIARLQDLGALSPDRAKTPREFLHALAKSKLVVPESLATRQQALSTLTSRLEQSWYGFQLATEADFRDSLNQLETLGCRLP
jgi:uncharacterized protein DUF4129